MASACVGGEEGDEGMMPQQDSAAAGGGVINDDEKCSKYGTRTRWRVALGKKVAKGMHAVAVEMKAIGKHPIAVLAILGMAAWNCYLSSAAWWGPKATLEMFYGNNSDDAENVDFLFGAVTAGTGVAGTLIGGMLLDIRGVATLRKGLWMSAVLLFLSCVLGAVAFGIVRSTAAFWATLAITEFIIFAVQPTGVSAALDAVPPVHRPFLLGAVEAAQHLLGDVPGPPIVGAVQNDTNNWHLTLGLLSIVLAFGSVLFGVGWGLALRFTDYGVGGGGGGRGLEGDEEELQERQTQ